MANLHVALANYRARLDEIRRAYPDESEDDLADSFEGEAGDLETAILNSLRGALYREAQAEAVKHLINVWHVRQERHRHVAQATRAAALQAMQEVGISKLPAADMTVSIGRGKPGVQIINEARLARRYLRATYAPNKLKIATDLEAGIKVRGATLGDAADFLVIHRR